MHDDGDAGRCFYTCIDVQKRISVLRISLSSVLLLSLSKSKFCCFVLFFWNSCWLSWDVTLGSDTLTLSKRPLTSRL